MDVIKHELAIIIDKNINPKIISVVEFSGMGNIFIIFEIATKNILSILFQKIPILTINGTYNNNEPNINIFSNEKLFVF